MRKALKIPVFVSCPTVLSKSQSASRRLIIKELEELGLEPRSLGRSDYPTDLPLREVLLIAKHCAGGLILGFEQFQANAGTWKRGTKEERKVNVSVSFPTPWNQLEAGILFSLKLPTIVFREESISGGVFDAGVTDVFVHKMPASSISTIERQALREVILKWQGLVRAHYYGEFNTK